MPLMNVTSAFTGFYFLLSSNQTGEQDVQMTNDQRVMKSYSDPRQAQAGKPVDQGRYNTKP